MSTKEIISKNIQGLRKEKRMTQSELADRLFYSEQAISKWERGLSLPDAEMLVKLAEIFEVPISYLFEEHEYEPLSREEQIKLHKKEIRFKAFLIGGIIYVTFALALTVLSTLVEIFQFESYVIFLYFLPCIPLIMLIINLIFKINRRLNMPLIYIFIWLFANAFYFNFIEYHLIAIYAIALVLQISLLGFPRIMNYYQKKIIEKIKKDS